MADPPSTYEKKGKLEWLFVVENLLDLLIVINFLLAISDRELT